MRSMDTQYISSSRVAFSLFLSLYLSLCLASSTRKGATCKTYPRGREACFTILSGWRGGAQRKRRKKRKRKNPLSKDEGRQEKRGEGREGYVTFDRTRKHNKSSEGCPWKRGGTRILFFIRPDAFSVSLPRTGRDETRVYARRAKASLSLRRVPRFEIKHLASRPSAPLPARPSVHACMRTRARVYVHGCTRLTRFQTHAASSEKEKYIFALPHS